MSLEIGLIGATAIAEKAILRPSRHLDDVRVRAVAASDRLRAEEFAARNDIERVHPDYKALVEDPGVNLVYVSLHNSAHHEWAVAAAEAGKHVVVEKPLCLGPDQVAAIAAAAHRSGVRVLEATPTAGHEWQAAVRSMIADGEYGALRSVRTTIRFGAPAAGSYRERPELGGGIFWDSGVYWLQAVQATVGLAGARYYGSSAFDGPHGVDRAFDAALRLPEVLSTLRCEVGEDHVAEHEFEFADAVVRLRNFLRPAAAALPLNLVIRRPDGSRKVRSFAPVSYYDLQLSRIRDLVADARAGRAEFAAAAERVTMMAAMYRQARERA